MSVKCPVGTKRIGNRCEETINVRLELTKLEWEVINQSLGAPIKGHLVQQMKSMGIKASENEISESWNSAIEKWGATWE